MALPGSDIDPVSKAASLASEEEATISLPRLTIMNGGGEWVCGGGGARRRSKAWDWGLGW